MKDKEYPLYPRLTDEGAEEAQKIMDSFKPRISALVNEIMDELYVDVSYNIESDHWTNYRNDLMDGLKGYSVGKRAHKYDFKEVRQAIYANHKDEIIEDLNQDILAENEKLKAQIESLQKMINSAH